MNKYCDLCKCSVKNASYKAHLKSKKHILKYELQKWRLQITQPSSTTQ